MNRDGQSRASALRPALESLETRWVPASVGTANENFIDQVYRDILHRAPDPGAAGWVAALDNGEDREDVIENILDSDEGLQNQINDLYVRFLGRQADATGLEGWSNFLRDDHTNLELAAQLIASDEYYQTQGDGTDFGFLNAVYMDVLCRPIGVDEADDRDDDFDGGFSDRVDIAESILDSDEGEDWKNILSIRSFLRAEVFSADQADDIVDDDNDDWAFAQSLLYSDEYYNLSQTLTPADFATIPSCENFAAQPIGSTQPTQPTQPTEPALI